MKTATKSTKSILVFGMLAFGGIMGVSFLFLLADWNLPITAGLLVLGFILHGSRKKILKNVRRK